MKHFHSIILTGLLVHFLPLNAQDAQNEEILPPAAEVSAFVEKEVASLTNIDEELSILEDEFEEFQEELASLEEVILNKEEALTPALQDLTTSTEETVAIDEKASPALAEPLPILQISSDVEISSNESAAAGEEMQEAVVATPKEMPQIASDQESPALLNVQSTALIGESAPLNNEAIRVNLKQAFAGSPIIYSILLAMSVFSVFIWLYSIFSIRSSGKLSYPLLKTIQNKLSSNHFEEALSLCEENNTLFCKMVSSGIHSRRHGLPVMIESMKAEGKRCSISFWQKIGLLNDIAIIAPMLGLLGTVLGMFYAFYDINRSIESVSTLFDGLGVSVGTTVAGLIVAILALILHSTAKYRLIKALSHVEGQAQSVATLIDDRTCIHKN